MPVQNSDLAHVFDEIADLLEIKGEENIFRIRAYRNAARVIDGLPEALPDMLARGKDLTELPGIGAELAQKIVQLIQGQKIPLLEKLLKEIPAALLELRQIPGLGPKKIHVLYKQLKITSLPQLKKAALAKKLEKLEGFGEKTEKNILEGIAKIALREKRVSLAAAAEQAEPLAEYLRKVTGLKDIIIAGSYRRHRETVGDIDILVSGTDPAIMEHFVKYQEVERVIAEGKTRSAVLLRSGLQVDLRLIAPESYGAALLYLTGSKEHNVILRKIAVKKKLKLNEYGVYKGKKQLSGKTERDVYASLGLPYIEPELRENRGEIEAGQQGLLPKLITLADIKGDLHMHTRLTDGRNTLAEMVQAARARGYEYIANTEHSQHVAIAHGLDVPTLTERLRQIDQLNSTLKDIVILKGIEVDILADGSLDLPDDILQELDLVVCAVHYKFNLSRQEQTARIIKALDNPYVDIFAHPTGRLIGEREPYDVDMEQILQAARERGCIIELNSHPARLDITDIYAKQAKELGVKIAISTDAHSLRSLDLMRYGVWQARRGWLEPKDVVNTRSLRELKKVLRKKTK